MPLVRPLKRRADGRTVVESNTLLNERVDRVTRSTSVRANRDVLMEIASYLDIRSLTEWRKSSPEVDEAAACFLNHEYNKLLASWFTDTAGFRDILDLTDSVISGSASLHFLQRNSGPSWQALDLDVYAPLNLALRMVLYLIEAEGYHLDEINRASYHEDSQGLRHVFHLSKGDGNDKRSVDVIQSATSSALYPLPFFWGTHVITFMGGRGFCLPYPALTLQRRAVLNPVALVAHEFPRTRTVECIEKYKARGYNIRIRHTQWADHPTCEQTHEACTRIPRFFGDDHCLIGSFSTNTSAIIPCASGEMPLWWRGGRACDDACDNADPFSRFSTPTVEMHTCEQAMHLAHGW